VQELINLHPDLLLADNVNPPAIVALQKETATIPILFVNTADPTDQGIAPSLSRPRGNVTGFTNFEYSIGGKWMDLLKQIAPNVARAAVVFNPDTGPHGFSFARAFEAAAASLGVEPITMAVRDLAEMERTVAALGKGNGLTGHFHGNKSQDHLCIGEPVPIARHLWIPLLCERRWINVIRT